MAARALEALTDERQPGLGQIQLAFDNTENLITNAALIAKPNDRFTFDAHRLEKDLKISFVIQYIYVPSVAGLKPCQEFVIMPNQFFIVRSRFFAVLDLGFSQVGDSSLDHNAPGLLFLAFRPGASG
jgi:hypothetical protein